MKCHPSKADVNINEKLKGGCKGSVLAAAAFAIYFGVCNLIVSPFSFFLPSQTFLHTSLQIMASFFIDCHYINMCIHIYIGISKYNQLSYFWIVFSRADHLALSNQFIHCIVKDWTKRQQISVECGKRKALIHYWGDCYLIQSL